MKQEDKFEFASCIALADQAIAPLTQLTRTLGGLLPNEITRVTAAAEDTQIDKLTAIQHDSSRLVDAIAVLNRLKIAIEKYK